MFNGSHFHANSVEDHKSYVLETLSVLDRNSLFFLKRFTFLQDLNYRLHFPWWTGKARGPSHRRVLGCSSLSIRVQRLPAPPLPRTVKHRLQMLPMVYGSTRAPTSCFIPLQLAIIYRLVSVWQTWCLFASESSQENSVWSNGTEGGMYFVAQRQSPNLIGLAIIHYLSYIAFNCIVYEPYSKISRWRFIPMTCNSFHIK